MEVKSKPVTKEVTIKRTFDAPLELVWEVWTNEKHLANWWGPKPFTNPRCEWNAKPGNKIHIDMKAPDGTIYPMGGEFISIIPFKKIVFKSIAMDPEGNHLFEGMNTVDFSEEDGKTTVNVHAKVTDADPEFAHYLEGMYEGWNGSFDKLDNYTSNQNKELFYERIVNASQELVYEVWTNPEHLAKWYGPNGFTITTKSMEVKPDGIWSYIMHGPDGRDYPNKIIFIEVVKPERLVYRQMDDDPDLEPVDFQTTTTFEKIDDNTTKVTMHGTFKSAEDLKRVSRTYHAVEGGHQTMDKMAALVNNWKK